MDVRVRQGETKGEKRHALVLVVQGVHLIGCLACRLDVSHSNTDAWETASVKVTEIVRRDGAIPLGLSPLSTIALPTPSFRSAELMKLIEKYLT